MSPLISLNLKISAGNTWEVEFYIGRVRQIVVALINPENGV